MGEKNSQSKEPFFEDIIKKTKTGITIPKQLREELFESDKEYYFRLKVPQERDKLILKILTKAQADEISKTLNERGNKKEKSAKKDGKGEKEVKTGKEATSSDLKDEEESRDIRWGEIFVYDFEAKKKVQPVLESAFEKFSEEPINFDDAMGRVKYALVSYLKASKSENAKLYYAVIRFLIKIIERFDQPDLIDWIYQKVIPHIESKFIYELALFDLIEICLKRGKTDIAEVYVKEVLEDIKEYPLSELYNIMSSFTQLVKKLKMFKVQGIFNLISDELLSYNDKITNIDYKIQIIEMLEDLGYIEKAYSLADALLKDMHPESVKIADLREIKKRLENKPI
jgi:hypothetical protein